MTALRTTLLSEGGSDRTLIPILDWLLQQVVPNHDISGTQWANLGFRREPPRDLEEGARLAVENYPCDLLFVHRDSDGQNPEHRKNEILDAVEPLRGDPPAICVIPIRMTEAWLLLDEAAIRLAAGNPKGRVRLNLPNGPAVERLADPKETLFEALRSASEFTGRRLKMLRVAERRHRVAELMDMQLLRTLSAFQALEGELTALLTSAGWTQVL